MTKTNSRELDMTNGSLFKNIVIFGLPLIATNMLQALFTLVDAAVVGRYSGAFALGAVGSASQLIFFFVGFIVGVASAVNVIVAYYIGAKNKKETEDILFTAFIVCLACGVVLMLVAIGFARQILVLLHTKNELIFGCEMYFKIYMLGLPATAIYNFGNAVLRSVGDTRRPFWYLAIAGIVNVILDLVFVMYFELSVAGVAIASTISQFVSAFLILRTVRKGIGIVKLKFKGQTFNIHKAGKLLKIGLPAGFQSSFFAFANMFIQMGVNTFDAVTVSGIAAAEKTDAVVYNVLDGFYSACACFIGQNYGAGKKDRILKTYFISLAYSFGTAVVLGLLFFGFGRNVISIFTSDEEAIYFGLQRLHIMTLSYCIAPFMDCTIAASRGLGKTSIPTIVVILGSCVFRIVWIFTIFAMFKTIKSLFLLYSVSWAITALAEIIYFVYIFRRIEVKTVQSA